MNDQWVLEASAPLRGTLNVPADKSITHRAVMMAAVTGGTSNIENYLPSEDCLRTVDAFRAMGVRVDVSPGRLTVHGAGFDGLRAPGADIQAGNSGTTVRLLSGILAGRDFPVRITGDESLSRRPMRRVIEPLSAMGVTFGAVDNNYLPLTLRGTRKLAPLRYQSPVPSAQVKSCILLAGIQAEGETSVTESVRSRDHTERMLAARGVDIRVEGNTVTVRGPSRLNAVDTAIPADISSAAFFLVAGTIIPSSALTIENVGINPTRDGILDVLRQMGAAVTVEARADRSGEPAARLSARHAKLSPFRMEGGIMPRLIDEIPVLVLAACCAEGTSVISGAGELRVKESDRLAVITEELGRMGARIEEKPDGLIIHGPVRLKGAEVRSHGDHRIAMTLAVAACVAEGRTVIHDAACVDTSFPGFLELLRPGTPRK